MSDQEFDSQLGLETGDWINLGRLKVTGEHAESGTHYEAITVTLFREAMAEIREPLNDFIFVDFGSGKGRMLFLAAELPFRRILGVEYSSYLHDIAERNIGSYRSPHQRCRNLASLNMDAATFDFPRENLVLYFFSPFRRPVMEPIIRSLDDSLGACPRDVCR